MDFIPKKQSKAETAKNAVRIESIIKRAKGDKEKEKLYAQVMADRITEPEKAYNRGFVAKEMGYEHIFEIFHRKAYDVGSVTVAEHRSHLLKKLLK